MNMLSLKGRDGRWQSCLYAHMYTHLSNSYNFVQKQLQDETIPVLPGEQIHTASSSFPSPFQLSII